MALEIPDFINRSYLKRFDLGDIRELNETQVMKMLDTSYKLMNRDYKKFQEKGMYSPAYDAYYEGVTYFSLPKDAYSLNAKKHELQRALSTLQAVTGTVTGAKKYWQSEERRIFGTYDKEKKEFVPAKRLTKEQHLNEDERKRFWRAYTEFMHQNTNYSAQSNKVQQALAIEGSWRYHEWDANTLKNVKNILEDLGRENENEFSEDELKRRARNEVDDDVNQL